LPLREPCARCRLGLRLYITPGVILPECQSIPNPLTIVAAWAGIPLLW
jgi:hypothetical protein